MFATQEFFSVPEWDNLDDHGASTDREFLEILSVHDRPVADLALALREIVFEEAPNAIEKVYSNHPSAIWFGFGPKTKDMFCYVALASSHVNLGFCRGASLSDPNHMLEGEGKVMRHIKFRSDRDAERPFVRRYIRAAVGSPKPNKRKVESRQ